jgi:cysteine desulfurase/selenocysteine lyase
MIGIAHAWGVKALIDGAQSVSHIPVNVCVLDADFFVFSGHKIFGPTGIGVLYGKSELFEAARPYQGGGNMIADVTFERTLYQQAPAKFEAGTGNIAGAVGLGAALDYVSAIGMENIAAWEQKLTQYGMRELAKVPGLRPVGTAEEKTSVLSFVLDRRSNEEVGKYLNTKGIAVRAGHHCAQPVLRFFGLEGTVRPSVAFYNTFEELDKLAAALKELAR